MYSNLPIKAFKCPRCKLTNYELKKEAEEEDYTGKKIVYYHYYYKCKSCGKEFVDRQTVKRTERSYKQAKHKLI